MPESFSGFIKAPNRCRRESRYPRSLAVEVVASSAISSSPYFRRTLQPPRRQAVMVSRVLTIQAVEIGNGIPPCSIVPIVFVLAETGVRAGCELNASSFSAEHVANSLGSTETRIVAAWGEDSSHYSSTEANRNLCECS
jgi:hypothetical protein